MVVAKLYEDYCPRMTVSAGAEVRNVAGLSYTTSRAFIFPSRGCSWASHSVLAALVDPNPLVHLKAAMLCRSKVALTNDDRSEGSKLSAISARPALQPRRLCDRWASLDRA